MGAWVAPVACGNPWGQTADHIVLPYLCDLRLCCVQRWHRLKLGILWYFDSLHSSVVKPSFYVDAAEDDVSKMDILSMTFSVRRLPYSAPSSMEPVCICHRVAPQHRIWCPGVEDSVVALRNALGGYGDIQWSVVMWIQWLVGGLEHVLFSHILGISSSQLTFIFFRGVQTTNQMMNPLFQYRTGALAQ